MLQSLEHQQEIIGLITQHQASIRAYIISLMPGIQGVSDVLQETNLILWEKRTSFEVGTNFAAWACTIALYEVKNHTQKIQRKQPILCLDEKLAEELAEYCQLSPPETENRIVALEHCLTKLNKRELQLIKQRYISDTTLKSYAESLGRPVGSLRVTLHRIRQGLRRCISYQLESSS